MGDSHAAMGSPSKRNQHGRHKERPGDSKPTRQKTELMLSVDEIFNMQTWAGITFCPDVDSQQKVMLDGSMSHHQHTTRRSPHSEMILCEETVALLWGFCIQFLAFHPPNVDSLWRAKVQLVSPIKKTRHIQSAKAKVGVQKWCHSGWATNRQITKLKSCWVDEQEKLTVTNTSLKHKLAQRKRIKEGAGRVRAILIQHYVS